MIKAFRSIRQRLFSDGRVTKYLLYALGEILLVVIGILLALQVNNWNERKRTRKTEVKLLIELREDLIKTREDLLTDLEKSDKIMDLTDSIYLSIIRSRANNEDVHLRISTVYLSEMPLLFPKLSAYKSIQAFGVNIISNDSLRKSITDLFELEMERVALSESILYNLNESSLRPYLRRVSQPGNDCQECVSLEEQFGTIERARQTMFVFSNPEDEFIHMLKQKYNIARALKGRYFNLNTQIDAMIGTIDEEINTGND